MFESRRQAGFLIALFASSFILACLMVMGLVYFYGASGTYRLGQILVSPESLQEVTFSDYDREAKQKRAFILNQIEFVREEMQDKEWGRFSVTPESYALFYKKVAHLRSLPHISNEIVQTFERISHSTLTLSVNDRQKIFQQIQFLDQGDIFRVELLETIYQTQGWIYFEYPGIYAYVVDLFVANKREGGV